MKENYDVCLQRLLKDEGGYTNNPNDRGGPTNYGITIADYCKYVNPSADAEDVRRMSLNDAKAIYRARYWDMLKCDSLPSGVDYSVFDYGVNSGVSRAKKVLNEVSKTNKTPKEIVQAINDERSAFLERLSTKPGQAQFRKGWLNRVARVRDFSLQLASKPVAITTKAASTGATAGAGALALSTWPQYGAYIIVGTLVVVAVSWFLYRLYERKRNAH